MASSNLTAQYSAITAAKMPKHQPIARSIQRPGFVLFTIPTDTGGSLRPDQVGDGESFGDDSPLVARVVIDQEPKLFGCRDGLHLVDNLLGSMVHRSLFFDDFLAEVPQPVDQRINRRCGQPIRHLVPHALKCREGSHYNWYPRLTIRATSPAL